MAFFDIYQYLSAERPMGRIARLSAEVSDGDRTALRKHLAEHGGGEPPGSRRCWYCGERDGAADVGLLLHKGVVQAHQVALTVPLPSCQVCRDAILGRARFASKAHNVGFGVGIALMLALLTAWANAATLPKDPTDLIKPILVGLLATICIAGSLGSAIGWIVVRSRAAAMRRLRSELDHPLAKTLLADGWRPLFSSGEHPKAPPQAAAKG
jgi:hypothetical protein